MDFFPGTVQYKRYYFSIKKTCLGDHYKLYIKFNLLLVILAVHLWPS